MGEILYLQVDMKARREGILIREVAERFGTEAHVLRHWEDAGLLAPARDASGYRRYLEDDIVRVAVIARNKAAGMTLDQIRALLDADLPGRRSVLEEHLLALDERAREIERSRMMTEHALRCESHDIATCPRFAAMVEDVIHGSADWALSGPAADRQISLH
jgi:MerR family transcriptional regulator, copper efflux regulator